MTTTPFEVLPIYSDARFDVLAPTEIREKLLAIQNRIKIHLQKIQRLVEHRDELGVDIN